MHSAVIKINVDIEVNSIKLCYRLLYCAKHNVMSNCN